MVLLLHDGGVHDGAVLVQDGLGESGGAGGEIDRPVIVVRDLHLRRVAGVVVAQRDEILGEGRAQGSVIQEETPAADIVRDLFDTADEFGTEDQDIGLSQLHAVLDLIRAVAEVQGHRDGAGLEDAEIDRQPVQAVHKKDRHLVALDDAAGNEHVGDAVGLFVEDRPGDLLAESRLARGLDQLVFFPGRQPRDLYRRIEFHQGYVIRPLPGISFQKLSNGHEWILLREDSDRNICGLLPGRSASVH